MAKPYLPNIVFGALFIVKLPFFIRLLSHRHDLDPVAVRVLDEVDAHLGILVADDPHLLVFSVDGVIVRGAEGQVELPLPQVVGVLPVPELRQLQGEGRACLVLKEPAFPAGA